MIAYKIAKKVVLDLLDGVCRSVFGIGIILAIYFAFISTSENANKYLVGYLIITAIAFIIGVLTIARIDKLDKEKSKPDSFLILILSAASHWAIVVSIAYFVMCISSEKSDGYILNILISAGCIIGSFLFACVVEGIGYRKKNEKE